MEMDESQVSCRACGRSVSTAAKLSTPMKEEVVNEPDCHIEQPGQINLCEACKKFYARYKEKSNKSGEKCCCVDKGKIKELKDGCCRFCRYKRCQEAFSGETPTTDELPAVEKITFAIVPCTVCGCSSSGIHFGVVSCEGCKGFFRRSMSKTFKIAYRCRGLDKKSNQEPEKLCEPESNCRKCRLQRCLDAGMSLNEVALGRYSSQRREEIDAEIRKYVTQGNFLKQKTLRKKIRKISPKTPKSQKTTRSSSANDNKNEAVDNSMSTSDCSESSDSSSVMPQTSSASTSGQFSSPRDSVSQATSSLANMTSSQSDLSLTSWISDLSDVSYQSSEWLLGKAVDASARLANISVIKVYLTHEMSDDEISRERMKASEVYMKCVSEFVNDLPGASPLTVSDRVLLFTQAIFPVAIAQLSLNFDVDRQMPNHFSLDREGPAWQIVMSKSVCNAEEDIEGVLREAGNRFVNTITNLQEFALFCALLVFNPETPNLSDAELVRKARKSYEMALIEYSNNAGNRSERRLSNFYQLLDFFRSSTAFFQQMFVNLNAVKPRDQEEWTPLFRQLIDEVVNLPLSLLSL